VTRQAERLSAWVRSIHLCAPMNRPDAAQIDGDGAPMMGALHGVTASLGRPIDRPRRT
jgi:hypothetical protein